jgi:hypothetical protein
MAAHLILSEGSCAIFRYSEDEPQILIHQCKYHGTPSNESIPLSKEGQTFLVSSSGPVNSESYLVFTGGIIYSHSHSDSQLMHLLELAKDYQLGQPLRINHMREYDIVEDQPCAVAFGRDNHEFRTTIEGKLQELGL